jgi:hypothetical protein
VIFLVLGLVAAGLYVLAIAGTVTYIATDGRRLGWTTCLAVMGTTYAVMTAAVVGLLDLVSHL